MVANKAGLSCPRSLTFRTHVSALIPLCVNSMHYSSVLYIRLDEWRLPLSAEQPGRCIPPETCPPDRNQKHKTEKERLLSCPANEAERKSCSFCTVVQTKAGVAVYGPVLLCVPPRLATRSVQPGDTSQDLWSSFSVRFPTDRLTGPASSFRICRRICRVVSGYRPRVSATVSRNSRMVMTEKE